MRGLVISALSAALLSGALHASAPAAATAATAAPVKVDVGQITGAQFAIANPPGDWNRDLLLIAHGFRPDSAPMIADLHPERASLRALLDEGWIVATTSYRKNGLVVADAIADLDALRAYIVESHGEPMRTILEGDSMGGLIVTLMAERDNSPYQGAVVFDPTLYLKDTNSTVGMSLLPRIPLLFVATVSEARQARSYIMAIVSRPPPVVPPALFLISREGHTNINQPERLEALRALNAWIERGRDSLPPPAANRPFFDATIPPEPFQSTVTMHTGNRGFDTRVDEIDAVYGTVLLDAQASDFEVAGIDRMTFFQLRAGGGTYRILYGRNYTDVEGGQWVAFPDADGRTVLARAFGNAASSAGLRVGDTVSLDALEPHPGASP
jgi:pimeloyl-ACP methyl ester carboxylesterase